LIELFAYALLVIGAACAFVGALGIVRFPDVYNRIHANTVAVVGGAILTLVGISLLEGFSPYSFKALIIAVFIFLTNPVGSHAIARAAYKSGVKLWPRSVVDKLAERGSE
jgi:multicomponent Na+:H+ antiporter subunit G